MAIWPEWKNVPSPMKTICLFVMNGSMPLPGAAAEAHAAVVVHELFGRGEHEHRVAAGVAVGDQVHRGRAVHAASCTSGRRSSCGARAATAELSRCGQPGQKRQTLVQRAGVIKIKRARFGLGSSRR